MLFFLLPFSYAFLRNDERSTAATRVAQKEHTGVVEMIWDMIRMGVYTDTIWNNDTWSILNLIGLLFQLFVSM